VAVSGWCAMLRTGRWCIRTSATTRHRLRIGHLYSQKHEWQPGTRRWRKRRCPRHHPSAKCRQGFKTVLMHSLQLLAGSPCQRSCNTNPFLGRSSLPSSWQSLRCNHRERWGRRQGRNRFLALGSPFRALCSTTPFYRQTIPPSNWRSHQRNCRGRQVVLAQSASPLVAALASEVEQSVEGNQHGALGSTMTSCLPSRIQAYPLRS